MKSYFAGAAFFVTWIALIASVFLTVENPIYIAVGVVFFVLSMMAASLAGKKEILKDRKNEAN